VRGLIRPVKGGRTRSPYGVAAAAACVAPDTVEDALKGVAYAEEATLDALEDEDKCGEDKNPDDDLEQEAPGCKPR
jgi:hypothetical protein